MLSLAIACSLLAAGPVSLPDIEVSTHTGTRLRLADWRGHPVVVTVWATWCRPCRAELKILNELANRPGTRLRVLALATDAQGWKTVLPYAREHDLKLPLALYTPRLRRAFGTLLPHSPLPQTLIFDCRGQLVRQFREALSAEELNAVLSALPNCEPAPSDPVC